MNLKRKITASLSAMAIIATGFAGATVLAPAANAATVGCGSSNLFYLSKSGFADVNFGVNDKMYSSMPCNWKSKQENALFSHFEAVGKYIKASNKAAWRSTTYNTDQAKAKELIDADLMTYTLPMAHIGGKHYNSELWVIEGEVAGLNDTYLSLGRMSHVYKVLFYTEAYLEHETHFADPSFEAFKFYSEIKGDYEKLINKKLYEVDDEFFELPSFDSIYSTFYTKMQGVVDQMEYSVLFPTYDERIETALTD